MIFLFHEIYYLCENFYYMLRELEDKYRFLIEQAERNSDWDSVNQLKREFESEHRNMSGDNSDESYYGNFCQRVLYTKEIGSET